MLAQWDGDTTQTIAHLEAANALAEEIGLPGEQWQILAVLGELYRAKADEARTREALGQAAQIVQTLATKIDDEGLRAGFLGAELVRQVSVTHVSGL